MLKLTKPLLCGNNGNHLTTKCFLPIIEKCSKKNTQFQMLPETTIFNFKILNFVT